MLWCCWAGKYLGDGLHSLHPRKAGVSYRDVLIPSHPQEDCMFHPSSTQILYWQYTEKREGDVVLQHDFRTRSIQKPGTNSGLEGELPVAGTLKMPITTYQGTCASDSLPSGLPDAFPVYICDPEPYTTAATGDPRPGTAAQPWYNLPLNLFFFFLTLTLR